MSFTSTSAKQAKRADLRGDQGGRMKKWILCPFLHLQCMMWLTSSC